MKNITATYNNNKVTFLEEKTSNEIGKIVYEKNKNPKLIFEKDEYSIFQVSKNEIEIFKNNEKIDSLKKDKLFGNYQFKNSTYKIKGISSWKGGTKLVNEVENTIATIQNKNALFNKGVYTIQTNNKVYPFFILLSVYIHIETSKAKTIASVVLGSTISLFVMQKFIFPHFN